MGFIFGYLFLSFMIAFAGNDRSIGFWGAFFVSLLLSPIIGLIITLCSKSNATQEMENTIIKHNEEQTKALNSIAKSNYIDDLYKLKSLYESKLISLEDFEKEKEILDKNRNA